MKSSQLKRKSAIKRSQPRRFWDDARLKISEEGERCRNCGVRHPEIEAAHIIKRERDRFSLDGRQHSDAVWYVEPVRIVPLCPDCHPAYDAHELDILHVLTLEERVQAVQDAGGIELARKRLAPSRYRRES